MPNSENNSASKKGIHNKISTRRRLAETPLIGKIILNCTESNLKEHIKKEHKRGPDIIGVKEYDIINKHLENKDLSSKEFLQKISKEGVNLSDYYKGTKCSIMSPLGKKNIHKSIPEFNEDPQRFLVNDLNRVLSIKDASTILMD